MPGDIFTLALTGDSIITRPISVYREPSFLRMIELLRGADAAYTNLETLFHNYESYAMNESGGTYMRSDPSLVADLTWAGFDLVSRANNHAGDYGPQAMLRTSEHVARAGIVQAGVGGSLAEAREAGFLETARGRIALISVTSTFPDHSRAGRTRGDTPPRPGLSPLRFSTTHIVPRERLESLRQTARELGFSVPAEGDSLTFLGNRFAVGERAGVRTEPHRQDLEETAAIVRNAGRLADFTIVSVHCHEGDGNRAIPAQFFVAFARAMVEAGADVVVGHGPHVLRGVEIYRGKLILYSLGNFIFQNDTLARLPSENYERYNLGADAHVADFNDRRYDSDRRGFPAEREIWESVIAVARWQREGANRRLVELNFHPVTLGFGQPRPHRGRPMFADAEAARRIIHDLARLSQPFGTEIVFADGVGKVRLRADNKASHTK